ncbi:zinc finger MYM-type protein 1-like [Heracleum sosnowskyi]|uniref:Zinc finger MYM-type protein 1-like n=1 Tax=Heracleum sosnowskyi TaxID=360622 RepID=A0AAD8N2K2_9APIA|nr:zinc finger MYM-type protein 1-like [Heracleum sosnowskyi]
MKRYYQAMLQNDIPPGQSENVNYVSEASVQNCQQIREEVNYVVRLCLSQALAFRGHDESEESNKKGNFLTFLQFLADHNEEIKRVVLDKAPENNKLTSLDIQKDVVKAMAVETTKIILSELGGDLFSILVDESRDISVKEQMIVLLRYVDKSGCIVERFLGVVHVGDTCSLSLKIGVTCS